MRILGNCSAISWCKNNKRSRLNWSTPFFVSKNRPSKPVMGRSFFKYLRLSIRTNVPNRKNLWYNDCGKEVLWAVAESPKEVVV